MIKDKNNEIAVSIKKRRRELGISQEDFSLMTGLGLRFIRELEQGKTTCRMDKVNEALRFLGYELTVKRISE